jgi:adenylate cyclase
MSNDGFRRKLAAILSADVKGYSRLMGDDEAATVRTITAYREVVAALVQDHRGRVVDSPGDNILAEFASVVDAVQCAVGIQEELKVRNAQLSADRRMEFRIGINLGDVIEDEGRLYGDGVNIAARLEALAEAGGICISGTVHEHIRHKLPLTIEHVGEYSVKNIAQPVQVYRVLWDVEDVGEETRRKPVRRLRWRWALLALAAAIVLGAGGYAIWWLFFRLIPPPEVTAVPASGLEPLDRPSIAVLPFDNMSGDQEQEYFSDGITEDLITDLAKISGLFVVARNSTFVYKGQAVDIAEVGRELGVRYVVEGSVRKAAGKVRVTAQLIDASTGGHLWADRYDRDLEDIFVVQDEVVGKIVAALAVQLTDDEQASLVKDTTSSLEAYDYEKRGWWYKHRMTSEDNDQARLMFERAIELDPQLASAYAGLGFTYYEAWSNQWSQDPESLDRASEMAQKALALDPSLPAALALSGWVYLWTGQHDLAIAQFEQAIAVDRNEANHYADLAQVLVFAGEPEEAVELVEKAMRLRPRYPVQYPFTQGFAYLLLDRFDEALAAQKEAIALNPFFLPSHVMLAGIYKQTGQDEAARRHMAEVVKIAPQLSVEDFGQRLPFKDPATTEWVLEPFRDAGLE